MTLLYELSMMTPIPNQSFFRVLDSQWHIADWRCGHYFSCHDVLPGEWTVAYYREGKTLPADYKLDLEYGRKTERSLKLFLELAPKYADGDRWDDCERRAVGELDGVCCFDNPKSAYEWATNAQFDCPIVEFDGERVSKIYEDNGYLAKVLKPIRCLSRSEFKIFHNIP